MRKVCLTLSLIIIVAGGTFAQEINFSRVQDMTIWYNQSLKTDKLNSLKLNYRNVNYAGMIAYNSVAAMFDMPIISKAAKDKTNDSYFSISAGAASDKSNQGILSNTLGMLGLSYSIPLGSNETYVSAGFQAAYYDSKFNLNGVSNAFGDQYNSYGPIEGGVSNDMLATGWSYTHFNINAGASIFHNSDKSKWYLGASMLQVNKPYLSNRQKSDTLRLKAGISVQGGYTYKTSNNDQLSVNMILNWQGPANKYFLNAAYSKSLPSVEGGASVGLGMGYRYNDAIVPNIELKYQKLTVGLLYDINISNISAAGISRNGLELALRLDF